MLLILALLVVLVQGAVSLSSVVAESGPVRHMHEDGISRMYLGAELLFFF